MSTEQTEASEEKKTRYRFLFLDGIRGLAAIYVVLFHFISQFGAGGPLGVALSPVMSTLTSWMGYGHYAVDVFIVLSGYSLMVPVARSAPNPLPKGKWSQKG